MRIKLGLIVLLVLSAFAGGCTSFGGISKADKPDSYYLTMTSHIFGIIMSPNVYYCTPIPDEKRLDCEYVLINYK